MKRYSLYCTGEQTKKALELGAPIKEVLNYEFKTVYEDVTAEQMISWLEKQGMFIEINSHTPDRILADWKKTIYTFSVVDKFMVMDKHGGYNGTIHYPTRKEATLAAIDAALEYLSKNISMFRNVQELHSYSVLE